MNEVKFIKCNGCSIAYIVDEGVIWLHADDVGYYLGYKKNKGGLCGAVYSEHGIGTATSAKWKYFSHIQKERKAYRASGLDEVKLKSNKESRTLMRKINDLKLAVKEVEIVRNEKDVDSKKVNKSRLHPGKRIHDKSTLKSACYTHDNKLNLVFDNEVIKIRKYEDHICVIKTKCCLSGKVFIKGDKCARVVARVAGYGTYYIDYDCIGSQPGVETQNKQLALIDGERNEVKGNESLFSKIFRWFKFK